MEKNIMDGISSIELRETYSLQKRMTMVFSKFVIEKVREGQLVLIASHVKGEVLFIRVDDSYVAVCPALNLIGVSQRCHIPAIRWKFYKKNYDVLVSFLIRISKEFL